MQLHVLPERTGDAAGNMAVDFLLLQRYDPPEAARFRHYTWQRPAGTFGYAQKIADVRPLLPAEEERFDLTRRATGGGFVDHRQDWTYALVLPRKHPLFERPGPVVYQAVHEALADALRALGASVILQRTEPDMPPGVCFTRAEIGDIIRPDDGRKVAGAAMKRGKHAILLQGSIWRPALPGIADWSPLAEVFPRMLAATLQADLAWPGWPEWNPEEEEALIAQYAAPEWIERR